MRHKAQSFGTNQSDLYLSISNSYRDALKASKKNYEAVLTADLSFKIRFSVTVVSVLNFALWESIITLLYPTYLEHLCLSCISEVSS